MLVRAVRIAAATAAVTTIKHCKSATEGMDMILRAKARATMIVFLIFYFGRTDSASTRLHNRRQLCAGISHFRLQEAVTMKM